MMFSIKKFNGAGESLHNERLGITNSKRSQRNEILVASFYQVDFQHASFHAKSL